MKFEYDGDSEQRECVAFIDGGDGAAWVASNYVCDNAVEVAVILCGKSPHNQTIGIGGGAGGLACNNRFYPGDKLTITF